MERKTKSWLILGFLVILIIGAIWAIEIGKKEFATREEMKCIAENSVLYVSKTCSHCAYQKQILGDNLKYFNLIDCVEEIELCEQVGIKGVPAWYINGTLYSGAKQIEQLKKLTGC